MSSSYLSQNQRKKCFTQRILSLCDIVFVIVLLTHCNVEMKLQWVLFEHHDFNAIKLILNSVKQIELYFFLLNMVIFFIITLNN